jgi:hypothetical protein
MIVQVSPSMFANAIWLTPFRKSGLRFRSIAMQPSEMPCHLSFVLIASSVAANDSAGNGLRRG